MLPIPYLFLFLSLFSHHVQAPFSWCVCVCVCARAMRNLFSLCEKNSFSDLLPLLIPPLRAFGYGLIATVVAALAKYASGIVTLNFLDANVVGCGMIGRGDLGFLLISQAFDEGLVDERGMGITLWALILCTLVSPFLFKLSLTLREKRRKQSRQAREDFIPQPGSENEETRLREPEAGPHVSHVHFAADDNNAPRHQDGHADADAATSASHDFETCDSLPTADVN
jgi:hypothetical protein